MSIQEQVSAETLRVSLASYLSQLNGKSVNENLRDAIQTSLVTSKSPLEVLEIEINRLQTLDRFVLGQYNCLDIETEEAKNAND